MNTPTWIDLFDRELKIVHREVDDSWRHGVYVTEVCHREEDDTYWEIGYRLSTDGEVHGLRSKDYTIHQVYPIQTTITTYSTIKPIVQEISNGN